MNIRKAVSIALVLALVVPMLSITAFAADDGWSFLDVVGALWDTASEQINAIGGFLGTIKNTINDGINSIGNFFTNLINSIVNGFKYLIDGIKRLFVPRDDYFQEIQIELRDALGKKFGNFVYLIQYLKTSFSNLTRNSNTNDLFVINFTAGTLFPGTRFDLLGLIRDYLFIIRGALTGFVSLMTVAFAYKRVLSMINT